MNAILKRMTGEELLLMRILNSDGVLPTVNAELDCRARFGAKTRTRSEDYWAGRTPAMRTSARLAA